MSAEDSSNKYVVVKGRFKSDQRKIFGIFYFILNREFDAVDTASVVVSLYASIYEISLNNSVADFHNKINTIKGEGQYALSTTQSLQEALKSIANDYNFYRDIEPYINAEDEQRLSPILQSFFGGILGDKRMDFEIDIQSVGQEEVNLDNFESVPGEEVVNNNMQLDDDIDPAISDTSDHQLTVGQVVLEVNLLLAPVGGKPVNHLKIGDRVMVRILPNTETSNRHIDLLKLRNAKGHINATPGEILSFKEKSGAYEITVQIAKGVFGKINEGEKVLVKMVGNEASTKPAASQSIMSRKTTTSTAVLNRKEKQSSVILLIGIACTFIMLILIFILFSSGI